MTTVPPDQTRLKQRRQLLAVVALIACLTAMRVVYAGVLELRTDEAYYWTWSRETVLSFLDHPPMIAWFIRFGTAIFGDTDFGVRFAGLLAMLVTQLLLADIVRRVTHDIRAVVLAVLMPEAAVYYGLLMAKVAPDVALIPFAVAMVWALVRLVETNDARWWLAAGAFAGLALLSKLTAVMLLPAVLAFMLIPGWRRRWLTSPYPWAGALIAILLFSPVLIWNAQHDWASFRFQSVRAVATHELSLRTVGDFFGLQFFLVGPILLPVVLSAVDLDRVARSSAARPRSHPARDQRDRAVRLFPLEIADIADRRHLADVPVADRICRRRHQHRDAAARRLAGVDDQIHHRWAKFAVASGIVLVVGTFLYSVASPWNLFGKADPIGGEAGYEQVARRAQSEMQKIGATWIATTDYRTYAMLRWYLKDRVPVVQINERGRFLGFRDPGINLINGHTGLYVAREPDQINPVWASTTAVRTPLGQVERSWRGTVMDSYALEKLTGWIPILRRHRTRRCIAGACWRRIKQSHGEQRVCVRNSAKNKNSRTERHEMAYRSLVTALWLLRLGAAGFRCRLPRSRDQDDRAVCGRRRHRRAGADHRTKSQQKWGQPVVVENQPGHPAPSAPAR